MVRLNFKAKVKMKIKSLKSQITMLMIIGLVIFIVVSLVLYLSKSVIKKQSKQSVKQTQETPIEFQPIKEFVSKCLDKMAKDAILLLGKQGGYIFKSQGGTLIDYKATDEGSFFVNYKGLNVVFNILPPSFSTSIYSSKIPDYPWIIFPYTDTYYTSTTFNGYFGISNLPPLDSSRGPHSMQTQIESFIDNNIATCLDFNIFKEQGYDIVMEPSNTSVIVGSENVRISSDIPISVKNPTTKEFTELKEFSTTLDIRLNGLYLFANELIKNDIMDIKFNISDIKNNKDFFNIQLIKDVFLNDNLIIITDEKSLISGKPYQYIFARKNRAPALYYLPNNYLQFPNGYLITQDDILQGSQLQAEDPDEDDALFDIKALSGNQNLPRVLDVPQLIFKVEANDGQLKDYQNITVDRI